MGRRRLYSQAQIREVQELGIRFCQAEVERRTGVPQWTLRTWGEKYSIVWGTEGQQKKAPKTYTTADMAQVKALAAAGLSLTQIHRRTRISRSTLAWWRRRHGIKYEKAGKGPRKTVGRARWSPPYRTCDLCRDRARCSQFYNSCEVV